ncbi:glycosyltransferase [Pseudomonas sp. CR3202]|uniref:glycosyltransferase n=1 Tax=Pseudomonas sp. CR3202 TaxID=3351532 RepID=UPI003BF12FD3
MNFLHAPNGGGYQNSISFISSLIDMKFDFSNSRLLIFKNTGIHKLCIENKIPHIAIKMSLLSKLYFELFAWKMIKKGDIVFALFGPPLPFSKNKTLNIGGMAISNVLHKEVDFWGHLGAIPKAIKKLKDIYRINRYVKLDYWIFETELLKRKAILDFNFPSERCFVVKMAPSLLVSKQNSKPSEKSQKINSIQSQHKFLFLSGAHPNKRLHILPDLAKELCDKGLDLKIVLTAPDNGYLESVFDKAKKLNVLDHFMNIQSVSADEVAGVIDACDYVCTFSVLESFSNNFVEAWAMEKPLFVTDADWSRESCKDSAVYVDFNNINNAAKTIFDAVNNKKLLAEKVLNGKSLLREYPSAAEKTQKYLEILNNTKETGKISANSRKLIRL